MASARAGCAVRCTAVYTIGERGRKGHVRAGAFPVKPFSDLPHVLSQGSPRVSLPAPRTPDKQPEPPMPCGRKRKRHKIATHKRKKRLRKNRHKKKNR